jgi:hypothetical protein
MERLSYSALMADTSAILTLKIDTEEPVEIGDFVGAFTSLANEFERYVRDAYPDARSDPHMFVREVRYGCIEADMITGLVVAIHHMDQILILEEFIKRWGKRFTALSTGKIPDGELESPSELKDWANAAQAIATDPAATHRLEAATFIDGKREIKAAFKFSAPDARAALVHIEERKEHLAKPETDPPKRVLMVFTRTDVHDATVNKKSGERVLISELSDKEKSVMFASEGVEAEIRNVIREADENVYKRGFVVDVVSQKSGQRVVAYSVTALHSVIDLED